LNANNDNKDKCIPVISPIKENPLPLDKINTGNFDTDIHSIVRVSGDQNILYELHISIKKDTNLILIPAVCKLFFDCFPYGEMEVSGLSKVIDDLVYVPDEQTGQLNLTNIITFPQMAIEGLY
jgi:hypothetical protein